MWRPPIASAMCGGLCSGTKTAHAGLSELTKLLSALLGARQLHQPIISPTNLATALGRTCPSHRHATCEAARAQRRGLGSWAVSESGAHRHGTLRAPLRDLEPGALLLSPVRSCASLRSVHYEGVTLLPKIYHDGGGVWPLARRRKTNGAWGGLPEPCPGADVSARGRTAQAGLPELIEKALDVLILAANQLIIIPTHLAKALRLDVFIEQRIIGAWARSLLCLSAADAACSDNQHGPLFSPASRFADASLGGRSLVRAQMAIAVQINGRRALNLSSKP